MSNETPLYTVEKSILPAFTFWRVVLFFLIIPTIMIVVDIIKLKHQKVEFYENYAIIKSGVLNKNEKKSVFPQILSIDAKYSIWGYGSIYVDTTGRWDVNLEKIKNPRDVKAFLETKLADENTIGNINHAREIEITNR